jgi:membrane protease YdiL (CAAX protease family)
MPVSASQWKPVQTNDIREQPLLTSGKIALPPKVSRSTWLGLCLSLFAMLLVRQSVSYFWPTLTFTAAIWKETLLWVSAITLLFIIRRGERLPFTSIGLGTSRWWKSILWGLALTVICGGIAGVLAALTGYGDGPGSAAFEKLPLWLITLIVLRAGVVEELFYRGYAIERLQAVGLKPAWAAGIPLVIFALGHWTGGAANILIALVLGAILGVFYLCRRDLVANMIGHGTVDFIANVLPNLFS